MYPGSEVLRNLLGVRDADELARREAAVTSIRIAAVRLHAPVGSFDVEHLKAFHKRIFADVYEWAGELRTVVIAKGNTMFALPQFVEAYLRGVLEELPRESYLKELDRGSFVDRLTHYYAEINATHPFREGNGRTQREFLTALAAQAGHPLRWSEITPGQNIDASRASANGDNTLLRAMLDLACVANSATPAAGD